MCCQIWVTRQMGRSDRHFHLIMGLPYTITINIPWLTPSSVQMSYLHASLDGDGGGGGRVVLRFFRETPLPLSYAGRPSWSVAGRAGTKGKE